MIEVGSFLASLLTLSISVVLCCYESSSVHDLV